MEIRSESGLQLLARLRPKDCQPLVATSLPFLDKKLHPGDIMELAYEESSPYEEILYGIVAEILRSTKDTHVIFVDVSMSFSIFRLVKKIERPDGGQRDWSETVTETMLNRLNLLQVESEDDCIQVAIEVEKLVITSRFRWVLVINDISSIYWNDRVNGQNPAGKSLLSRFLDGLAKVIEASRLIAIVSRLATKKRSVDENGADVNRISLLACPYCPDSDFYSVMPTDWQKKINVVILMRYCIHKRVGKFIITSSNSLVDPGIVAYRVGKDSLLLES